MVDLHFLTVQQDSSQNLTLNFGSLAIRYATVLELAGAALCIDPPRIPHILLDMSCVTPSKMMYGVMFPLRTVCRC